MSKKLELQKNVDSLRKEIREEYQKIYNSIYTLVFGVDKFLEILSENLNAEEKEVEK